MEVKDVERLTWGVGERRAGLDEGLLGVADRDTDSGLIDQSVCL